MTLVLKDEEEGDKAWRQMDDKVAYGQEYGFGAHDYSTSGVIELDLESHDGPVNVFTDHSGLSQCKPTQQVGLFLLTIMDQSAGSGAAQTYQHSPHLAATN
ncbi:hypothetical protein EJ110_NYTH26924 [Nymphaea thermarum]|nr:hypothetical protein EJ110_NYTH26924 [Nymphaea thermarum]